ncbi:hypothetical protein QFZ80_003745 [Paenibacillus sp. V4I7]|nr:hypothetical protein [Paenibacillus sp. V4I7]
MLINAAGVDGKVAVLVIIGLALAIIIERMIKKK